LQGRRGDSINRKVYINIATRAVCVVPLYEAEIVAEVEVGTTEVLTVKVALVAPAGTVKLEGTAATVLSVDSRTNAPPGGAGPLSVTTPMGDCAPPTTLIGVNVRDETVGGGGA
jgi:hypothetical protein